MWMNVKDVVKQGLIASENNKPVKVSGKINRMIAAFSSALPDWLSRGLFAGKSNKYRKR